MKSRLMFLCCFIFVSLGWSQQVWHVVGSSDLLKEPAIGLAVKDLQIAGQKYDIQFKVEKKIKLYDKTLVIGMPAAKSMAPFVKKLTSAIACIIAQRCKHNS